MTDPWMPLLAGLPLSRTEREVVKRFESDPEGRTFLPVADILRSHRLVDESLELLTQGVERHGTFTVARVVLARELLQKGMVTEAWRTLEDSPVPLKDNLLAQKLRFRLAVLLGDEPVVRATYQHLKTHQMLDAEGKRFGDLLEVSGLQAAREKLLKELRDRGVDPVLPPPSAAPFSSPSPSAPPSGGDPGSVFGDSRAPGGADQAAPPPGGIGSTPGSGKGSGYAQTDDPDEDARLEGFHVVQLDEIFRPGDGTAASARAGAGGIELDSTTLADIYARQGHYTKALEVYRRLLRMTPTSDLLRRKVSELAKLDRDQRVTDLTVDPALVDRMETVEIIDRQIKFYNDLLGRLKLMAKPAKGAPWRILVASGANLDLLGLRQPDIYGQETLAAIEARVTAAAPGLAAAVGCRPPVLTFFQTNHEGAFLDKLTDSWAGAVLNPGAWTHTSLALGDRVAGLGLLFIEAHLSNLAKREEFRQRSYAASHAAGVVYGLGADSFVVGLFALLKVLARNAG